MISHVTKFIPILDHRDITYDITLLGVISHFWVLYPNVLPVISRFDLFLTIVISHFFWDIRGDITDELWI